MQELQFLHSAHCLMLIDICMKFREDSLRGFQVTERTRFVTDRQTDVRTDGCTGKNNMSPNPEGGRHNSYAPRATCTDKYLTFKEGKELCFNLTMPIKEVFPKF